MIISTTSGPRFGSIISDLCDSNLLKKLDEDTHSLYPSPLPSL